MIRKRILVVHRYYRPDETSCAIVFYNICSHFSSLGHDVTVLTSKPSYRENYDSLDAPAGSEIIEGVLVRRLPLPYELKSPMLRVVNALRLGFRAFVSILFRRYDLVIASTSPPVLGAFFVALGAKLKGTRFIYSCMDVYPEMGCLSGDFKNKYIISILRRVDTWNCRQANPVLVHSRDMRNTLRSRANGDQYNIEILNNFVAPLAHSDDRRYPANDRLTLIYAGNIGRFQGLDAFIDAMILVKDRADVQLVILGNGLEKDRLMQKASSANANVSFISYQPSEVAKAMIRQADIGIVSLIPEMYKYAYPSKSIAYLESSRPFIAAIEEDSELASEVVSGGYGFAVPAGDHVAIAKLIISLADDSSWKIDMRAAAHRAYLESFTPEIVLTRWQQLIES